MLATPNKNPRVPESGFTAHYNKLPHSITSGQIRNLGNKSEDPQTRGTKNGRRLCVALGS